MGFAVDRQHATAGVPLVAETYALRLVLPRGQYGVTVQAASDDMRARFPGLTKALTVVEISLRDGATLSVHGFGMPFRNDGHPAQGMLLEGAPIVPGVTLRDVLEQRRFVTVHATPLPPIQRIMDEALLPPPLRVPIRRGPLVGARPVPRGRARE